MANEVLKEFLRTCNGGVIVVNNDSFSVYRDKAAREDEESYDDPVRRFASSAHEDELETCGSCYAQDVLIALAEMYGLKVESV